MAKYPLELATVRFLKSNYITFTDSIGNFNTSVGNELQAEITYIGYKSKIVRLDRGIKNVMLQPDVNDLSELIIESEKVNYINKKKIKTARAEEYFGFQFGTEHCTYISNTYHKQGVINSISLFLSKLRNMNFVDRTLGWDKDCKECKVDYVASFKVSIYEYDFHLKKPGKLLSRSDIIVHPNNKSYKFTIDLDSLKIIFPKDGVCIGVELINTKYKNPKTTFAFIGPALGFTKHKADNEPISWIRYRNEGWEFKNVLTKSIKGLQANVLAMEIEIKI